jgi:hypothetical protein
MIEKIKNLFRIRSKEVVRYQLSPEVMQIGHGSPQAYCNQSQCPFCEKEGVVLWNYDMKTNFIACEDHSELLKRFIPVYLKYKRSFLP